ncbi:SH3 domain-containing protein [Polaribacter sp. HL-MS24]|uniref:SH3 domain-containing protein n=1 Tax=Polaribacter sp. HL-MS24 TaxID=3077735 RepID=UPI0029342568|nr:SH3 domain-containing protein [Polaribacter sp. HL-MS24]WOC41087.1 SH3 domain-containing protein [Polaribacter sp. HL-MS24]
MKKILFLLVCISHFAFAQTSEELFATGNTFYKEGDIEKALESYLKIEDQGRISSELFFNLGNCYYKLNKVGATIYNYERALQLDPLNQDAANNLVFAKRLTIDRIEELPKSIFEKLNEKYLQKISYNQWAIVSCVFSLLTALFFLFFYFSYSSSKKRFFFVTSILCILFFFTSLAITYHQYNYAKDSIYGIVFTEKTTVKNEPTSNSEEVFTLHEGTKVKVLDTVDDWKKIKLVDGKIGWILAKEIQLLPQF